MVKVFLICGKLCSGKTTYVADVILNWGFWTKEGRNKAKAFYQSRNIECELHYLDISDEVWRARINQRNQAVIAGKTTAYIVDSALAAKFEAVFEPPGIEEADVWVNG